MLRFLHVPLLPMNVTVNETYSDGEIVLDYHKYVECTLRVL